MATGEGERAPAGRRWRLAPDTWATLGALAIVALGTALRMAIAVRHSNAPMIDENEVVEQSVAFMGPDLRFYFTKYGPFTMYVISGIYRVSAALQGLTPLDYAARVFFDGAEHYAIARVYTLGWLELLALVAFFMLRRQVGRAPALLVCSLLAFPFLEVLASGARIDVPQAAFQCISLLALTEASSGQRSRYWLMAGVFAGLAIATKPLPALLIAPSFLLASWFAAADRGDGTRRSPLARLGVAIAGRGLWLAALAAVLVALVGNPALLDVRAFIQSQREAIALHSSGVLTAHTPIGTVFSMLRAPFLAAAAIAAALALVGRDRRAFVVGLFALVYVSAFVGRQSRTYFMVAPAAALCLLVGYGLACAEAWLGARRPARWLVWASVPLAAALVYGPGAAVARASARPSPAVEANRWIEANVPAGTRLFHLGGRPYGTYLVTTDEKLQGRWGDHFEYGRSKYPFLRKAYHLAYERYSASGRPRYRIEVRDEPPHPRQTKKNKRWITDGLLHRARGKQQKYIVIAGYRTPDVLDLGYAWFKDAILEHQYRGVAIFRVPDPPARAAAAEAPSGPAPLAGAPDAASPAEAATAHTPAR